VIDAVVIDRGESIEKSGSRNVYVVKPDSAVVDTVEATLPCIVFDGDAR
jgi:hypothetical protein